MPRKILIRPELAKKFNDKSALYKKALSRFIVKQDKKGLNLEKLHGKFDEQPIYTIRMNKKSRLVLCPVASPAGQVWLLIDILLNHEYIKLKEKPQGWLSRQISKTISEEIVFNDLVENTQQPQASPNEMVTEDINIEISNRVEFCGRRFIVFDSGQEQAQLTGMKLMPAVITGPPGSGKTSVGVSIVWHNIQQAVEYKSEQKPVLVIAKSVNLIHFLSEDWHFFCANFPDINPESVVFKTPQMIYEDTQGAAAFKGETEFVHWFKQYLDTQAKLKKGEKAALPVSAKEAPLVYQELHTMSGYRSFDNYMQHVTSKLSLFPQPDARQWLWQVYENYLAKLVHDKAIDLAFQPIKLAQEYEFIVVDEAQDLSRCQISSLASQSERVIFCVGDHQRLFGSETTVPFIRSVYWQKNEKDITTVVKLGASYRCPKEIIALANGVLGLKYQAIGGREFLDKNELVHVEANSALSQAGHVYWLEQEAELNPLINDKNNAQFAVITSPELLDEAAALFGRERVFTPESIKGLEYDHVLLYRLLEQDMYRAADPVIGACDMQNAGVAKSTEGSVRNSTAFNELFVAVTRAKVSVSIHQPYARDIRYMYKAFKELIAAINNSNDQEHIQSTPTQSSEAEWRRRVIFLEQQGLYNQAQALKNTHLQSNKSSKLPIAPGSQDPAATGSASASPSQVNRGKKANAIPPIDLIEEVVNKNPEAMEKTLQYKDPLNLLFHSALNTINTTFPALSLVEYFKQFYVAALKGQEAVINTLKVLGKAYMPYQTGPTPLYAAAQSGHEDTITALIKNLSEAEVEELINQPTVDDETALFAAAQNGHRNVVSCLLKMGASCFKACQLNSERLISIANNSGKEEVVTRAKAFIESKGLTVDTAEILPILPHEIAYIMGYSEIEQLIQVSMSLPRLSVNSHFGFFKEEVGKEVLQNNKYSLRG
ncbi:ankyrin repeat domain-containing protein [Legionella sp. CNM-1927-20]|uniref:ankyrin repeat domain-containing protein n=1 Tax=Legionella sp. CNM-1927-20 TaxID=3422221 RepID=UPI00403AC2B1